MMDFKGLARHFMKKDGTSELDVVYPIKSECQSEMPKTRFKLRVSSPLLPFGHLLNSFILRCVNSLSATIEKLFAFHFSNLFTLIY